MEGAGGVWKRWFAGDASPDKPPWKLEEEAPHTVRSMQSKTCTRGAAKDYNRIISAGHQEGRLGGNERGAQGRTGVQRGLEKKTNSLLQ